MAKDKKNEQIRGYPITPDELTLITAGSYPERATVRDRIKLRGIRVF